MATILPNRAQITYTSGGATDVVLSNQTNTKLIDQYTMELTKTPVADTVRAGADASYVVRLENNGSGTLYNPVFTDDLGGAPDLLTYVEGSAQYFKNGDPVSGTATAGTADVVFEVDTDLEEGDNIIVIYAASTNESQTEDITNTVTAEASTRAQTASVITATASATISIEGVANVSVFKSADKESVISGDTLTYTFTLMNTGAEAVDSIIFEDALPPEFTVQTVSYTVNGVETPIPAADYTIEAPNTLIIPADGSDLVITIPAATEEGPGITVITVTGLID